MKEKVKHHNIQKFLKTFVETRLNGKIIKHDTGNSDVIRLAERDKLLIQYNENIKYCCYKTIHNDKDAILIVFTFILPGPITGSSAASEMVMDMVGMLEKKLMPVAFWHYSREIDASDKSIGILKLIKHIEE